MPLVHLIPFAAAAAFLVGAVAVIASKDRRPGAWVAPAALAAGFLAFSIWTVAAEGPLGFWPNHNANLWGNQVWIDLLMAIGAAFFLIAPRARAAGMKLALWLVLIVCTGSIGLYAMLARLLWLELNSRPAA